MGQCLKRNQVHQRTLHLEEPSHRQDHQRPSHLEEPYHIQDQRRPSDSESEATYVMVQDVVSAVNTCWYHSTISHHMHILCS